MTPQLNLQTQLNLKAFNTMGLDVCAAYYVSIVDSSQLELLPQLLCSPSLQSEPLHVLGGGSNIIFNGDVSGIILHVQSKGIRCLEEDDKHILLQVEAGELWDDFIAYCVERNYSGIENLSLIPGTVGAAPIQNIGAYGQEVGDTITQVNCINVYTAQRETFEKDACNFAYRTSCFKQNPSKGLLLESVVFRLDKVFTPNISYQPLATVFKGKKPSLLAVRQAVISLRKSKLPDPHILANTGSFFQNPVVSQADYERLTKLDENIPAYPQSDGSVKLAAAYLIEQCGFKGKTFSDHQVGMHAQQALVLVNYGAATAEQVLSFASEVRGLVLARYGVDLQQEPVII